MGSISIITIQCKLITAESTRCDLWHLMAEKHTPLITELLKRTAQDSCFQEWCHIGKIPLGTVKETCQQLKKDAQLIGPPGRFYASAIATVNRNFKSWLALQTRLRNQIAGHTRWLAILQSDDELRSASQSDINTVRAKASELLTQLNGSASEGNNPRPKKPRSQKQGRQESKQTESDVSNALFNLYGEAEDTLTGCAIAYVERQIVCPFRQIICRSTTDGQYKIRTCNILLVRQALYR